MSGNDDTLRINNPMYSNIYNDFCNYIDTLSVLLIKLYNDEAIFELRNIVCDIINKIENNLIICTDGEIFDNQTVWNWVVYINNKFDVRIAEIAFEHDVNDICKNNKILDLRLVGLDDFNIITLRLDDYSVTYIKHENDSESTYKIITNIRSLI